MKRVLSIIMMVLLVNTLKGQSAKTGMLIGINLANWKGDDVLFAEDMSYGMNLTFGSTDFKYTSESRIGFNAGFLVDYRITNFLSVQPEISYSQKGAKFTGGGTVEIDYEDYTVDQDLIMQLDYVDFALMARILLLKSNVRPYIIGGPGLGYLVLSKMKVKTTVEDETNTDSNEADQFRKLDYHVNVGGGFEFSGSMRIEFRYYHFFNPVTEESNDEYKLFNSVKSINLVFCF